jgi:hypothetical protein
MRTRSWYSTTFLLLLLACAAPCAFAAPGLNPGILRAMPQENWEARQRMQETIFAPLDEAAKARPALLAQSQGSPRVSFQRDAQSDALYLVFANQEGSRYPLDGAGTYIIKRSMKGGGFVQAKIFLQDGPGSYLRLFPGGDRTRMEVYLFGQLFQAGIALPVPFERLLTRPLADIMDMSAASVDWDLALAPAARTAVDERIEGMVKALRARLPGLRDMDDGAMDRQGRMVSIATGQPAGKGGFNCSGFAKWIVDGLVAPLTGMNTDIAALKSRNAGKAHAWASRFEEELDPWFGLDWSRGLARAIAVARTGRVPPDEEIDVRDSRRVPYVRDVGYPVPQLQYVLYFLARESPGDFYVGSVNAPSALAISEGTPTLRQHHHVIVLFPWFDAQGVFQVTVMERNTETSLASLTRRYAAEFAHLVHIDSEGEFAPPKIE